MHSKSIIILFFDNGKVINKILKKQVKYNFKKVLDKCRKTYNNGIAKILMQIRTAYSTAFWNILDTSKIDSNCVVNIEHMFDFLKGINERN